MYNTLLSIHSLIRWLVVLSLLYSLYRAYSGWLGSKPFTKQDNSIRHITATIAHVQLIAGLWLYFISPIINYFLHHYAEAKTQNEVRFFGMEHSTMMLIAIILITIGSAKAKRKTADRDKFKTIAVWYSVALLIILICIPWPFSPMAGRPYWRMF